MTSNFRSRCVALVTVAILGSVPIGAAACTEFESDSQGRGMSFSLKTTAFQPGGDIPAKHTCQGEDVSPALSWSDPPGATKSFALIVDDPDAPAGSWNHWVLYNIPPQTRELSENVAKTEELAGGARQGRNDFRRVGYGGPCPPPGKPHRYFFKLYALDTTLNVPAATKQQVEKMMQGPSSPRPSSWGNSGNNR